MKVKIGNYKDNEERKIKIRIDDWDIWNLDNTLAMVIVEGLKKFKEQSDDAIPAEFVSEAGADSNFNPQLSFDFYNEDSEYALKEARKKWKLTLKKMIWAFEQSTDSTIEDSLNLDEYDEYLEKIKYGRTLFANHFHSLWT